MALVCGKCWVIWWYTSNCAHVWVSGWVTGWCNSYSPQSSLHKAWFQTQCRRPMHVSWSRHAHFLAAKDTQILSQTVCIRKVYTTVYTKSNAKSRARLHLMRIKTSVNWPQVYKYSHHMNTLKNGVFTVAVWPLTDGKQLSSCSKTKITTDQMT